MPSFPDSIFLFVLALLLFGPKRLPVLARELGKWVGEFRRASNEFKMQMEDELRLSEQADRNKQIAAMEAAAPVAPVISAETPVVSGTDSVETQVPEAGLGAPEYETESGTGLVETQVSEGPAQTAGVESVATDEAAPAAEYEVMDGVKTPLPIAVSGDLKIMPPRTGLPVAAASGPRNGGLQGLLDAIPAAETAGESAEGSETTVHGN
jgi:sec-independent protein translocase protein TatB